MTDPNLDNIVFHRGRAVALIDFDLAGPGSPVWDLATAARLGAPLRSPTDVHDVRRGRGLRRLRILVDAYGLDGAGRGQLVSALRGAHDWMCEVVRDGARRGVPGFVAYWTPRRGGARAADRRLAGAPHRRDPGRAPNARQPLPMIIKWGRRTARRAAAGPEAPIFIGRRTPSTPCSAPRDQEPHPARLRVPN